MANLIAFYLLIMLGAALGGPVPPLPLDLDLKTMDEPLPPLVNTTPRTAGGTSIDLDPKTVDEPLLPATAGTAGGPLIDQDLFAMTVAKPPDDLKTVDEPLPHLISTTAEHHVSVGAQPAPPQAAGTALGPSSEAAATAAAAAAAPPPLPKMLGSVLVVRIPLDGKVPFHSTAQVRTALYGSTQQEQVPSFRRTAAGNVLEVYCESALMADEKCVGMMSKVTVREFSGTSEEFKRPFGNYKDNYSTDSKMSFWFERLLKETGEWDEYDRKIAIYPAGYGGGPAYHWRGTTIMARTQDTWTTYAHELGHDLGLPHSSAPEGSHAMFAYGDEAMMGRRVGKTDLNAAQRYQLGWIEPAAVLDDTGILKPLNVAQTAFSPGLVLKQECAECWSKPVTSTNNQNNAGKLGGTLIASFRVGRDAGGDNNDFGIVGAGLVNKVHVHFYAWGTTQRWAALAEDEEYEWRSTQSSNGAVLGGLVVCKLVVTTGTTEDYAAIAVGTDAADARSKCAPWRDSYPETLSIAGNPAYASMTRGQYTRAPGLEHAGAPVYKRSGLYSWSLYKRNNGKWYLDFNEVDDSWSGTVNYALSASDTPFTATWNRDMVVAHSTVSVVGKPAYSATSAGVYNLDLQTTFAGAPVYRRGTSWSLTWSLYKRSNGKWYLDFNELDDTWAGTVNYALDATDLPFAARFNRGGMKVLRGSSWQAPEVA